MHMMANTIHCVFDVSMPSPFNPVEYIGKTKQGHMLLVATDDFRYMQNHVTDIIDTTEKNILL